MLEQYLTQLKAEIFVAVVFAVIVGLTLWHLGKMAAELCGYIIGIILALLFVGLRWLCRSVYCVTAAVVDASFRAAGNRSNNGKA